MKTRITGSTFKHYQETVRKQMIPYQWCALNDEVLNIEPSHVIKNFEIAAGRKQGDYFGMLFQDSDLYKWIEAAAYSLSRIPDPELEAKIDWAIDLICEAQRPDGYINTYYQIKEGIENRWTNLRDNHELYCAGHLIEGAIAYKEATGKDKLFKAAIRFAEHIKSVFGETRCQGYSGHEELELALVRLYLETQDWSYLQLARFFIDQRGLKPNYFDEEKKQYHREDQEWWHGNHEYSQSHKPVTEQNEAVGHAVRAVYLYSAVADLAGLYNDTKLKSVIKDLWDDVTKKKMSVNGGIGASSWGEAFADAYDLPNDTVYNETCASVGLVFWAKRMLNLDNNAEYADILENAVYNGSLCGMDIQGKKFFYVNPLEVNHTSKNRRDHKHVKTERQGWLNCACCPPNLARLVASIENYIYHVNKDTIYTDLYAASIADLNIDGLEITIAQETNYPWEGCVDMKINTAVKKKYRLALRIPHWVSDMTLEINGEKQKWNQFEITKGYLYIEREWGSADVVRICFPMEVREIFANPAVTENIGKLAVSRGPILYCAEQKDNGNGIAALSLTNAGYETYQCDELLKDVVYIKTKASRVKELESNALYTCKKPETEETEITLIPYFLWGNRGYGELAVWLRKG